MSTLTPRGSRPSSFHPRVLAIDWSGARARGGRDKIWLAEVRDGALVRLDSGRSRTEVVDHLIDEADGSGEMIVGLDFAFSFPMWFLEREGVSRGGEVWRRVAERGEAWLEEGEDPFWGRKGQPRPELAAHFRHTELAAQQVTGSNPKSVFQIAGGGAVGTGSLRGMPHLARLADAGFAVWPFDDPGPRLVLEIYPRLLTGPVVKSDPAARLRYLNDVHPGLEGELRDLAMASEDALDAAVSAVIMAKHLDRIRALGSVEDPVIRSEGWIWWPKMQGPGKDEAPTERAGTEGLEASPCPFCSVPTEGILDSTDRSLALADCVSGDGGARPGGPPAPRGERVRPGRRRAAGPLAARRPRPQLAHGADRRGGVHRGHQRWAGGRPDRGPRARPRDPAAEGGHARSPGRRALGDPPPGGLLA